MKKLKKLSGMQVVSGSGSEGWKSVQSDGVNASAVQVMKKYKLVSNDKFKKNKKSKVKKLKGPLAPSLISQAEICKVNPKPKKKKKKKMGGGDIKAKNGNGNKSTDVTDKSPTKESESGTDSLDMSAWNDMFVHPLVLKGLEEQGFACPTPIQRAVLPAATRGQRDVVGAAETGSGKTLAFAIPILNGILEYKENEQSQQDKPDLADEEPVQDDVGEASEDVEEDKETESEVEEDFSDPEMEGVGVCVRVVNDVEFDFDEDGMVFIPPPPNITFAAPKGLPNLPKAANTESDNSRKKLHALILTPTRELAIQVKDHIVAAAAHTGIQTAVVVGGMAPQKQRRLLAKRPEIVVGTPGRLWDLISEGDSHLAKGVKDIKYLAIDETDRMVEKGHFEELQQLLEMINADESKKLGRQNFVFSATLSMVHDIPGYLLNKKKSKKLSPAEKLKGITGVIGVKDKAKVVDLTKEKGKGTSESLIESRIGCAITEKDQYLYYMLTQHPGRTLVFCNSIDCVRRLVNLFGYLKVAPLGLHAQMQQRQRLKNLDRFAKNPRGILIATDVAARGLDIKDVQHVIHYQVPRTSENYVHRSGRTARASKEGISVMLIEPAENFSYKKLSKNLGRTEDEMPTFPVDGDIFPQVKQRVQVARELDKLLLSSKKERVEKSWFKKAAEEMDIEVSDDGDEAAARNDESVRIELRKKELRKSGQTAAKQAELNALLATPILSTGFSGKYPTMSGRLEVPKHLADASGTSAIDRLASEVQDAKNVLKSRPSEASLKNRRSKKKKKKGNKPN